MKKTTQSSQRRLGSSKLLLPLVFLIAVSQLALAQEKTFKQRMEELVGYEIVDRTAQEPKFKQLQAKILELKHVSGDIQEIAEELINLTLQLYPDVNLDYSSKFIAYGMGNLLYVYATPGTYDNHRFIYDEHGLIEWAPNWYNTNPGDVDFLNDRMDANIIYCAGQKILHSTFGHSYGSWVVKDYRYIPGSEALYQLWFAQNGAWAKKISPEIVNDPNDFRKKAQAATVNDVYHRVYDLDPDMFLYSKIRLLINEFLSKTPS